MRWIAYIASLLPLLACAGEVTPPLFSHGAPSPAAPSAGEQVALSDGDLKFTLYLPRTWVNGPVSNSTVTLHFHTVAPSAIASHVRRGSPNPLLVLALGSGSAAYRKPFEDTSRFTRLLSIVEREVARRNTNARVAHVEISSFSAGYGALRELLKTPAHFSRIDRIVLLDSLYGGLVKNDGTNRVVEPEHVNVWLPFAEAARRGEKTLVMTLSQVHPDTFASTGECAAALLARLGMKLTNAIPTATNAFPLLGRADAGNFHVWSYGGTNAAAHMAHVHHAAEVWRAIDSRLP